MRLRRRGLMLGGLTAAAAPIVRPAMAGPIISAPGSADDPMRAGPLVGPEMQPWQRYAVPVQGAPGRPAITIVIDDMGVMHPGTSRAAALPGPLTLSWFPFARHLPEQIGAAAARGHETTLHMPMQATSNSTSQTGPDPLRIDLPPAENLARLRAAIDVIPGSVGINNHMGSVATRSVPLMDIVALETRARGLLFLDSVVIPHSVAASQARAVGVPAASRDVFIDHVPTLAGVRAQLELTERMARRLGNVIAIGHPHPWTLEGLEAWLPTLQAKGFVLWPLSAAVAWRNALPPPALGPDRVV